MVSMVSTTSIQDPRTSDDDGVLYDLRPHQVKALDKLGNGKILRGGVGTGKSRVAAAYYAKNEAPRDIIVITTAKKRDSFDWQEEFYRIGIGPKTGPVDYSDRKGRSNRGRRSRSSSQGELESEAGTVIPGSHVRKSSDDVRTQRNHRNGKRSDSPSNLGGGRSNSGMDGGPNRMGGDSVLTEWRTVLNEDRGHTSDDGRLQSASFGEIGGHPWSLTIDSRNPTAGSNFEPDRSRSEGSGKKAAGNGFHSSADISGTDGHDGRNGDTLLARRSMQGRGDVSYHDPDRSLDAGSYPWVLTIDSWNNIAKYADVAGAFFIFDEQRLVGSGDWSRKFLRIAKRNRWILLTATPGDTWMDYIPVFVANNFYKNRTAFKREHVVYNSFTKFPKVDRYINIGKLIRLRSQLLVEMPYERHTKRRLVEVPLEFDKELLEMVLKKRWHIYEDRPLRDVAEMFSVGRRLVNSDPSRLEMVRELWKKHPKLIIFYNFNYELMILRTLGLTSPENLSAISQNGAKKNLNYTSSEYGKSSKENLMGSIRQESSKVSAGTALVSTGAKSTVKARSEKFKASPLALSCTTKLAEWNGHKHQPIPDGDRWIYLVQYTAGAEGWNCVDTDAMIMHSRNYSWRVTEQAFGRIDRLNTPFNELWYYDFTSESFIDRAIGRALQAKETFNEAKYARLFKG